MAAPGTPDALEQQTRGIDLVEPVRGHLEPRGLALGAEAVLPARKHARTRPCVALEQEHDVDRVLERTGPGEVAVLGDVAGHEDRDPLLLGHADEGVRAVPHLRHAARHLGCGRIADRLDRVNREEERVTLPGGRQHGAQVAARREGDRIPRHAEPTRSGGDLAVRLLAGDEQASAAVPGEAREELEQQRGLPDPGLPREEDHRGGDEPAAEHPVETRDPGGHAGFDGCRASSQHEDGPTRRCGASERALDRPPRAAPGAPTHPLRNLLPALGTREDRPGPWHGADASREV